MIFNNLKLSYLSPEIKPFLWKIVGCKLLKNFDLSTNRNDLKVAFCHIDFFHVDCHDCNFLEFVFSRSSCVGSMASNPIPSSSVLIFS